MERTERFYKIESLLKARTQGMSFSDLRARLEVSPATLKRDIRHLRERFDAPIEWNADAGGYRWLAQGVALPGPLYSASEIHALLTLEELLEKMDPAGVLAEHVEPLRGRLTRLLDGGQSEATELRRRIRIISLARRAVQPRHFQIVTAALVRRQRLRIVYRARATGRELQREISPLRLLHYRENWHLDAWCHLRNALRNFSLDAIHEAALVEKPAKEVSDAPLDALFKASYGIFAGTRVRWARLRFSAERARWVANEQWHPEQKGRWDGEGRWLLDLPYADPRELVMDILRHVPEVEVLGPAGLREAVRESLEHGLRRHQLAG